MMMMIWALPPSSTPQISDCFDKIKSDQVQSESERVLVNTLKKF